MAQSIGDALGIVYRGADANYSTPGRSVFEHQAVTTAFQLPGPSNIGTPMPSIATMLGRQASGGPGDNIDVYA